MQATNRGISLSVDLPDTLPLLFADGSRLGQVLSNLLSNALKFTPAGGSVIVEGYDVLVSDGTARLPESSVPRWLPVLPDGAWMVVLVTDTGIGIAEEDQHGLFKRFFRTSSAQRDAIQGTGLGLYLAKAIVDAHGGCIGVDSAMGRGSRFWFAVPVIERREG